MGTFKSVLTTVCWHTMVLMGYVLPTLLGAILRYIGSSLGVFGDWVGDQIDTNTRGEATTALYDNFLRKIGL
jgi:hypothetical protein